MKGIAICVLCLTFLGQLKAEDIEEYMKLRTKLIEMDSQLTVGIKQRLTHKEELVNDQLMFHKNVDISRVPFYKHYFQYQGIMRRSRVYQMIRLMPKGAALHVHGSLMLDPEDLLKLTYEDYLYMCSSLTHLRFHFSLTTPKDPCPVAWKLVEDLRMKHKKVSEFDSKLKERLTLGPEDGLNLESDENEAWEQFGKTIAAILSLIEYRPVREKYIYKSLQNLYDDNVMYVEIRLNLHPLYELNGTFHDRMYMASLHNNVAKRFMEANPDFAGLKIILSPSRKLSAEDIQYELDEARAVKLTLPDVIAGFDLVGHEDRGRTLKEFVPALLQEKKGIDYYFHAGETNQHGTPTDENLFDAILLGTKRIGHATSLIKHPVLIKSVHRRDIAVEVNVISNSVLSLVKDVRSHPLVTYLSQGLPVVLSSDDPGVWGARPLTDDFYVAFAAITNRRHDLRVLKQLAINSIRYSALDDKGKTKLFRTFAKRWLEFLTAVIQEYDMV
ncbi:adenosine deaminase 2-like [Cydia splendana]|uniref:adenosine deaminase 2-like n=1 Tax=Cydia splendana TaxID=1100963 RepID=UPI002142FA39